MQNILFLSASVWLLQFLKHHTALHNMLLFLLQIETLFFKQFCSKGLLMQKLLKQILLTQILFKA